MAASLAGGRTRDREGALERGSERGRLGTEGEGEERYREPDDEQTWMATLLDGDFSGIARQIAMPSGFPSLLEML